MSFKPDDVNAQDEAIRAMEDYIKEFLVIGTRQQLNKLSPSVLYVGDHTIDPSVNKRNLGTIFDNSISTDSHINQVCKTPGVRRLSTIFTISVEFLNTFHRNPLKH